MCWNAVQWLISSAGKEERQRWKVQPTKCSCDDGWKGNKKTKAVQSFTFSSVLSRRQKSKEIRRKEKGYTMVWIWRREGGKNDMGKLSGFLREGLCSARLGDEAELPHCSLWKSTTVISPAYTWGSSLYTWENGCKESLLGCKQAEQLWCFAHRKNGAFLPHLPPAHCISLS